MDCPQCGGTLSTFTFDGREAFVCEECGYVGIEADHHGEPVEVESWTDALRRFHEEHVPEAVGSERTPVEHAFRNAVEDADGDVADRADGEDDETAAKTDG
jgi:DNA-directed RNA polymerase subunit M/transcription elongation factor TFIIS